MIRFLHQFLVFMALAGAVVQAQNIIINELSAGLSDRLLKWENGVARIGAGPQWFEADYEDGFWEQGVGGFGFGDNDDATELSDEMLGHTPSLYLRHTFTVSAADAQRAQALMLDIDYDDGFIAYVNGVEVARKNMGAPGSFGFFDQGAFNSREAGTAESLSLGPAAQFLQPGENLLAIQVHNLTASDNDLTLIADLSIANPTTALVVSSNAWNYWVGRAEPSGGLFDANLIGNDPPPLIVDWGTQDFDDSSWAQGPGGFGFGDGDDATDLYSIMYRRHFAIYLRQTFVVSSNTVNRSDPIQLTIDYDDGFIAYLNGVEIARRNMGTPGEFVPYNTGAQIANEAGSPQVIQLDAPLKLLQPGTNVFAVQVHNITTTSTDMSLIADLDLVAAPALALIRHEDPWRYFPGASEPATIDPSINEFETAFLDWVELVNTSSVGVSLFNWSLSDDKDQPDKWKFPATGLLPGEHLIVFCSGLDLRNAAAGSLHTNFKLSLDGEHLGLYNPGGQLVSQVDGNQYPAQDLFHSYGWDAAANAYRYFALPTPGATNTGNALVGIVGEPEFGFPPGYYPSATNLSLSVDTPGADIYYTTNGSIPTLSDTLYTGPIALNTNRSIRARAFLADWIPSKTITRSYLINQHPIFQTVPAYVLTGDAEQALFDPFGVTTIVGGHYTSGVWSPTSADDYNLPMQRGRPHERQISLEVISPVTQDWLQIDAGLRMAGSRHIRPRYVLNDLTGRWESSAAVDKPSFNIVFRGEYGASRLEENLFPHSPLESLDTIRLRGGKNDWLNPFIDDEVMRRLYGSTGQPSAIGAVALLYVNGEMRMYYNPVERLTEDFFRDHFQTDSAFDIMNHRGLDNGDRIAWDVARAYRDNNDLSILANYQEMTTMIDPANLADYLIVNCYGGTWDWPGNNWYAAREKSPDGRYGWYMWDAEGGLGRTARALSYNSFTSDLQTNGGDTARFYRKLVASPEWRILFADRVQKHFFGDGGMADTNIWAVYNELKNEFKPLLEAIRPGTTYDGQRLEPWIAGRRPIFLGQLQAAGLWPTLGAPEFPTPGGAVSNGFSATILSTNTTGTIYYTLDGSDPRAVGGGTNGLVYTGPVVLDRSRDLKARVHDGGSWSPLAEATYISELPPIVITEIMYNMPNGSALEYIELQNIGTSVVELTSLAISGGITFDFNHAPISQLAPGAYLVLVSDLGLFNAQYDSSGLNIGVYNGRLNNDGEDLTLSHDTFGLIQTFSFNNSWYAQTDGGGFSLNIRDPHASPEMWDTKSGWRASDHFFGTPGAPEPGALPLPDTIIVNEVLTHTDASPVGDWVELHNTSTNPVNLSGWYLSDSENLLTKFKIPDGTVLSGGEYLVFDATNHFRSALAESPFGLSELGDDIVLTSYTNSSGLVTGYSVRRDFDAAAKEVTFGRHLRSDGKTDFVALREATKGASNATPHIGPLVIHELMYHPLDGQAEYIKLYNVTGEVIDLAHWEFRDALSYTFPPGEVLLPHSCLFLTSTNPAVFRVLHGIDPAIQVLGPLTNALNNAGDDLKLYRPGEAETNGVIPYILVDRVDYKDLAPWPVAADGTGPGLFKRQSNFYGNDPASWMTGDTNGLPDACILYDSDGDQLPDRWESQNQHDPLDLADALHDLDEDRLTAAQEFIAGTAANDAADTLGLTISNLNHNAHISFTARQADPAIHPGQNRYYTIEVNLSWPGSTWQELSGFTNVQGQNQAVEHLEVNGARKVYRLKTWLAP